MSDTPTVTAQPGEFDPYRYLEWIVTGECESPDRPEQCRIAVAAFDNEADAREWQEREFTMTGQVVTRAAYLASKRPSLNPHEK